MTAIATDRFKGGRRVSRSTSEFAGRFYFGFQKLCLAVKRGVPQYVPLPECPNNLPADEF